MNKRNFLKYFSSSLLLFLYPQRLFAAWFFLRPFLTGAVRTGTRGATRKLTQRGASRRAVRNSYIPSGNTVYRDERRSLNQKNRKLPEAIAKSVIRQLIKKALKGKPAQSYTVPKNALAHVVGEQNVKFSVYVENNTSNPSPIEAKFYLYDIDAKKVESIIPGFGYLQAHSKIEMKLTIPLIIFPGRKILVTNQENAEVSISEVFYVFTQA